jgi:hypothetical protein
MAFKRLDPEDISISAELVVAPAWTDQANTLTQFFVDSNQIATTGRYYHNVYQTTSTAVNAAVQFSIAYGNSLGSGSGDIGNIVGKSPSAIIYGQYRTLVNGDEDTDFVFGTATPKSIYAITVNRSRYKERLRAGSLNLIIGSGSNRISLIDNSTTQTTVSYTDAGRVYDIVSGSGIGTSATVNTTFNTTGHTFNSGSYGKFLPDVGVIILNGDALAAPYASGGLAIPINVTSNATSSLNNQTLFQIISTGSNFTLQSEETISSNYVFVRVRNSEFNYSTNPSNITGSGELRWDVMVNTPQSYITTVGMYNDNNDLLGVAKLSRPLLKDFTKEALVRIKLDY